MADAGAPPERVGSTRRERIQQRALREILDAGREEMRLHGPAGVTMRSVARAVDMTPSGLYRHVSGHDELLGLLAADAYEAMGAAMDQAAADAPAGDHATAWYRVMIAMRQWYLDHRAEYELLVSPRLIARPPHRLDVASGQTWAILAGICADAIASGQLDPDASVWPLGSASGREEVAEVARLISVSALASISGHIGFEVRGLFADLDRDLQEYFGAHVRGVMRLMGFVVEPAPSSCPASPDAPAGTPPA